MLTPPKDNSKSDPRGETPSSQTKPCPAPNAPSMRASPDDSKQHHRRTQNPNYPSPIQLPYPLSPIPQTDPPPLTFTMLNLTPPLSPLFTIPSGL